MTNDVTASYELGATVQPAASSISVTTNVTTSAEPTAIMQAATSSTSITANVTIRVACKQ